MRRRPTFPLLALLALAAGCDLSTSPTPTPDVALAVSGAVVRADQPVTLTVTTTNRTSRTLEVTAQGGCMLPFIVRTTTGEVVGPPLPICAAVAYPPRPLAPGESMTLTASWSGERSGASAFSDQLVPAGEYELRGRVDVLDVGTVLSAPVRVRVER
jgi:hypothetical protein